MDSSIILITALLPLAAAMVIFQVNPYHALVIRGILGAVAALVYTVLGAADVALTEALVGTLLAISLYAVAVRSSLVLRIGVVAQDGTSPGDNANTDANTEGNPDSFTSLMADLRRVFGRRYLRLEIVSYPTASTLHQALVNKEIHAICEPCIAELSATESPAGISNLTIAPPDSTVLPYRITNRLSYLHSIMQLELTLPIHLNSLCPANLTNPVNSVNPETKA